MGGDQQVGGTGMQLGRMGGHDDVWVTWFYRLHRIFAVVGVLIAISLFAAGEGSLSSRFLGSGLALVLGGWCWLMLTRFGAITFGSLEGGTVFLAVSLPLFITLGTIHPAWQMLIFMAYWQIFSILPTLPAVIVATGFTVTNIWAQQGADAALPALSPGAWTFVVIGMAISGAMALFIQAIIVQSQGRQQLLEELEATRDSLAISERAAGVAAERQRLAGEVHDTIAQDFTSVIMHLEAAEARIDAGGSPAEHIAMAREAARKGLRGSRGIVHALLPDILEGADIDRALVTYADRWSRETGIPVVATVDGTAIPLDRHTEVVVFRALQEILANVKRHAQATQVTVTLSYLDDLAVLDVHDDGSGFDPDRAGGGVGLHVSLDIESSPGEGTTIAVSVKSKGDERLDS